MDSGIPTDAIESRPARGSPEDWEEVASSDPGAPTARLPVVDLTEAGEDLPDEGAATQVHSPLITTRRDQCAACGSALAPDQRYCVECGQRRGTARVPQLDGLAERTRPAGTAGPPPRRRGTTVNSTLLAIVGTLLLALGVGVLIGRTSSGSNAKIPPVRVLTVAGAGAASGAGTAATPQSAGAAAAAAKANRTGAKAAAATKHTKVKLKVVKVGTPGKGRGYQHGHFTGNFFGPESEEK
jgi:hypothetical protein